MKRLIAWALAAALLAACMPMEAFAQTATPDEPSKSAGEAVQPEEAPAQTIEPSAQETAEKEPAKSTPTPQAPVSDAPQKDEPADEKPEVDPQAQAWTVLEDGTLLAGKLQSVLRKLLENGQSATVYLTKLGEITVKGIPMELFDDVELTPDEEALGEERGPYDVTIEAGELPPDAAEGDVPPLTVRVFRVRAQHKDTEQESEPTPDPAQVPAFPRLEPGEVLVATVPPSEEPAPEPTPEPIPTLSVEALNLKEGAWQNVPPTFVLSGIEPGMPYIYGVFICGERLVLLKNGAQEYVPSDEGEVNFRFAIMDLMGDVVALSDQLDVWLDMTPPDGPYLVAFEESDIVAGVEAWDDLSGVEAISYDGGATWEPFDQEAGGSCIGEKGQVISPGEILVRDRAGNISANPEQFTFGRIKTGGGHGTPGGKRIKHVAETMDYSRANYNALELVFPEGPVTELVAGDTTLALTMTADVNGESQSAAFSAELTTWRADEQDTRATPNALVLTAAQEDSELNTWLFSGDVYRLLYNSGIDYLVFASGDYIAAVSTAGFTGGTAYAKMKAGGISTKHFAYTLCQDEALRETTLSVEVGGETYLLEEDRAQPMYRYDVLVGTREMMREPFESYLPGYRTGEDQSDE